MIGVIRRTLLAMPCALLDKGDNSGFWDMFQDNIAMDISDDWMDLLANFVGASGKIQREGDPRNRSRDVSR